LASLPLRVEGAPFVHGHGMLMEVLLIRKTFNNTKVTVVTWTSHPTSLNCVPVVPGCGLIQSTSVATFRAHAKKKTADTSMNSKIMPLWLPYSAA